LNHVSVLLIKFSHTHTFDYKAMADTKDIWIPSITFT